jgi:DNA recombination protein RmuC
VIGLLILIARRRYPSYNAEIATLRESTRAIADQVGQLAQLLSTQLGNLTEQVSHQLTTTAELLQRQEGTLGDRLSGVSEAMADVREKMGTLAALGKQVADLAQDIASLEDIFRAPKARGAFGEWLLSDLLFEVLPKDRFCLQYSFRGGERVDAAIFLEGMTVPVDAKFPLESFTRLAAAKNLEEQRRERRTLVANAKMHVDKIAQKYIRPDEGTTEFALMYIPAEGVYFELVSGGEGEEDDFLGYALARQVMPCSPSTFYSYLRSVAMGLKGLALTKNVQAVLAELGGLQSRLATTLDDFGTLGTHLRNARGKYDEVEKALEKLREQLDRLAQAKVEA